MELEEIQKNYRMLRIQASLFDNAQKFRIATSNRLFQLQDEPTEKILRPIVESVEKDFRKSLLDAYRFYVPKGLQEFQQSIYGLGEHTFALLLGQIGDPVIAMPAHWEGEGEKRILIEDEPYARTVSQLWAYAGVGDFKKKLKKGITAKELAERGRPYAKRNLRIITEGFLKASKGNSKYKEDYYRKKEEYNTRIHGDVCPQCHAKEGDPWKPGHSHSAALRYAGKAFLKDCWLVRAQEIPEYAGAAYAKSDTL